MDSVGKANPVWLTARKRNPRLLVGGQRPARELGLGFPTGDVGRELLSEPIAPFTKPPSSEWATP
jgi:hypothetical protein